MSRRKRAWNWAVAVALVIFGGASLAAAQSSTQGGGLSTKAILALEECFDAFQNFTCGAAAGTITGTGTDGRNTRFSGASTIADGSFLDDGTNATLEDDVEFIIGETATAGTVGGITWNTFAGGGVERLDIDGTGNAGILMTHGILGSGAFLVADGTGSFIHTFSQQAPKASGDSGPAWIFFVDGPTDMDDAADQRVGLDLEMESNAGDVAGAQQIGLFIVGTGATAATQDQLLLSTTGWDNDIVIGTETVRTALNFATPSGSNIVTVPAATGTIALTSALGAQHPFTVDTRVADDSVELQFGDSGSGFANTSISGDEFSIRMESVLPGAGEGGGIFFALARDPAESGFLVQLSGDQPILDGTDETNVAEIRIQATVNHTGGSNFVNMLNIVNPTLNANATEQGIVIETGFVNDIAFENVASTVQFDTAVTSTGTFEVGGSDVLVLQGPSTTNNTPSVVITGALGAAISDHVTRMFMTPAAMNGSDNQSFIDLVGFTDANHTGAGNTVSGLRIGAVTSPDADANHAAVNISTGWEFDVFANGGDMDMLASTGFDFFIGSIGSEALVMEIDPTNAVGGSADLVTVSSTIAAMDGSDTVRGLFIDLANAVHTGTNVLAGLEIDSISPASAGTSETAVIVGTGWDLHFDSPTNMKFGINDTLVFDIEDPNAAGGSADIATFAAVLGIMDGNDTVNGVSIDLDGVDHTGTGNVVNGLNILGISLADANATESAITIGASWDYFMTVPVQGSTAGFEDPGADRVAFFVDENTNRVGGGALDCVLVARLSDATEINIAVLVTDGVCP